MKPKKFIIGIDPDTEKSGVALKCEGNITLHNWRFFDLYDNLNNLQEDGVKMLVLVEGGWLNKSNWHKKEKGSAAINAKIGSHTGANHETGKKIVEMLEYLKIPHRVIKPTKTKIKAKLFKMITKIDVRTNQEQRDAYMLIHGL
ncbi:hypothetical protein [Thalassobellus suaedae]|uniref:Uncharacterized protein n=1 Tax=Thalassobellus suaedae TaxID=3074124 RepID=A0ABY9XVT6_9FLAO|nr:hypothetical protein RHP51_05040 [Flavobacteriaceae bacterium HL-DH14]